ncbi:hypothetical protein [Thiomicrospira pelophila]|uniref:hypothetical protein n=1 Tax=Thiomicrospira pelophila TaxID=934 RepID=UPI00068F7E66|nr:hypothetical protein [Thiomicrospira pelophila]
MTKQEEEFVHFASCIAALNSAWLTIKSIKEQAGNTLVGPAFRFALIEYSKPYKVSFGNKKWMLDTEHIPDEMNDLHKRIIEARDQIHAHSDLTVMEAQVYIYEINGHKYSGIVKNKITGLEELKNIDDIQSLIEKTLNSMYVKEQELEAKLPLTKYLTDGANAVA